MKKRRSILFYFDNYHLVAALPDAQLGLLFRALMECGQLEAEGQDGITDFAQRYPTMEEGTRMAFRFMADNLRRDAAAYREKCANYSAAAQRREERSRRSGEGASEPHPERAEKAPRPNAPGGMSRSARSNAEQFPDRSEFWKYV